MNGFECVHMRVRLQQLRDNVDGYPAYIELAPMATVIVLWILVCSAGHTCPRLPLTAEVTLFSHPFYVRLLM